jgi:hypothetical protein
VTHFTFLIIFCGKEVFGKNWYCYKCYKEHEQDILNKAEWNIYLQNEEKRRRRLEAVETGKLIFLGDEFDISDDGRIISLREFYDE